MSYLASLHMALAEVAVEEVVQPLHGTAMLVGYVLGEVPGSTFHHP